MRRDRVVTVASLARLASLVNVGDVIVLVLFTFSLFLDHNQCVTSAMPGGGESRH